MKFLKSAMTIVVSVGIIFSLAACGSNEGKNQTKEKVDSLTKKYTIATDTTFAPFEFQDEDGRYVGIDIDIMNAIAQDQGFDIEIQSLGFNAALQAVISGQADGMIAGMSITEERKETFDFSDPYYDSAVVMATSSKDDSINSYEDLRGKTVAVKIGTEGEKFANSISEKYGFKKDIYDDSNAMYQAVLSGSAVACFEDYPVIKHAVAQGLSLKVSEQKEEGSSYGFGVKKGKNSELLEKFNIGLANIKSNGKYDEILDKYIQG